MEVTAYRTAAEAVGRYFEMKQSGGSTNLGVDNNSIQSYLDDDTIPWGAPYVNTSGLHIEQMGKASWTEAQWKKYAPGTLDRTAWLIAEKSEKFHIPIRALTDEQLARNEKGITTHRQCSRVFHIAGGHTDPGTGFPYKELLETARKYADPGPKRINLTDKNVTVPRQKKPHRAGWWNFGLAPYIAKVRKQGDGDRVQAGNRDPLIIPVPKERPKWWRKVMLWKQANR